GTAAGHIGIVVAATLFEIFHHPADRETAEGEVEAGLVLAALAVIGAAGVVELGLPGSAAAPVDAPAVAGVRVGRVGAERMLRRAVGAGRRARAVDAGLGVVLGIVVRRVADPELEAGEVRR